MIRHHHQSRSSARQPALNLRRKRVNEGVSLMTCGRMTGRLCNLRPEGSMCEGTLGDSRRSPDAPIRQAANRGSTGPPSPRLLFKDHIRYTDIYTPILYADDARLCQMIREAVREELARTTS